MDHWTKPERNEIIKFYIKDIRRKNNTYKYLHKIIQACLKIKFLKLLSLLYIKSFCMGVYTV